MGKSRKVLTPKDIAEQSMVKTTPEPKPSTKSNLGIQDIAFGNFGKEINTGLEHRVIPGMGELGSYDTGLSPYFDKQELRASNQGPIDTLSNSLVQLVTGTLGELISTPAYAGQLFEDASEISSGISGVFYNVGEALKNFGEENFPIYMSKQSQQTVFNPFNSEWTGNAIAQFGPTVAMLAASFLTEGLATPALVARLSRIPQLAKMFGLVEQVTASSKLANVMVKGARLSLYNRAMEGGMEAVETFKSTKAKLAQEFPNMTEEQLVEESNKAAKDTYWNNWQLAMMDFVQYTGMLSGFGAFSKFGKWGKAAGVAGGIGSQMGGEALEEGFQYAVSQEAYTNTLNRLGVAEDSSISEEFAAGLGDTEMQQAMVQGALGGAVFSALGKPMEKLASKFQRGQINPRDAASEVIKEMEKKEGGLEEAQMVVETELEKGEASPEQKEYLESVLKEIKLRRDLNTQLPTSPSKGVQIDLNVNLQKFNESYNKLNQEVSDIQNKMSQSADLSDVNKALTKAKLDALKKIKAKTNLEKKVYADLLTEYQNQNEENKEYKVPTTPYDSLFQSAVYDMVEADFSRKTTAANIDNIKSDPEGFSIELEKQKVAETNKKLKSLKEVIKNANSPKEMYDISNKFKSEQGLEDQDIAKVVDEYRKEKIKEEKINRPDSKAGREAWDEFYSNSPFTLESHMRQAGVNSKEELLNKFSETKKEEKETATSQTEITSTEEVLYHTSDKVLTIDDISVDPRKTRQGRKGQYGGFYTYDNLEDIQQFSQGNSTSVTHKITLNEGVKIQDYNGSIERLNKEKLEELRSQGYQVIRGKSLFGKSEIIIIDKAAIKSIEVIENNNSSTEKPTAPIEAEITLEDKLSEIEYNRREELAIHKEKLKNDLAEAAKLSDKQPELPTARKLNKGRSDRQVAVDTANSAYKYISDKINAKYDTEIYEAKKADIEAKRKAEIGTKEKRTYTDDKGVTWTVQIFENNEGKSTIIRGEKNGETVQDTNKYSKEVPNEKIYEVENPDGYEYSDVEQVPVEGKRVDKINQKYDSQLEALEKERVAKEALDNVKVEEEIDSIEDSKSAAEEALDEIKNETLNDIIEQEELEEEVDDYLEDDQDFVEVEEYDGNDKDTQYFEESVGDIVDETPNLSQTPDAVMYRIFVSDNQDVDVQFYNTNQDLNEEDYAIDYSLDDKAIASNYRVLKDKEGNTVFSEIINDLGIDTDFIRSGAVKRGDTVYFEIDNDDSWVKENAQTSNNLKLMMVVEHNGQRKIIGVIKTAWRFSRKDPMSPKVKKLREQIFEEWTNSDKKGVFRSKYSSTIDGVYGGKLYTTKNKNNPVSVLNGKPFALGVGIYDGVEPSLNIDNIENKGFSEAEMFMPNKIKHGAVYMFVRSLSGMAVPIRLFTKKLNAVLPLKRKVLTSIATINQENQSDVRKEVQSIIRYKDEKGVGPRFDNKIRNMSNYNNVTYTSMPKLEDLFYFNGDLYRYEGSDIVKKLDPNTLEEMGSTAIDVGSATKNGQLTKHFATAFFDVQALGDKVLQIDYKKINTEGYNESIADRLETNINFNQHFHSPKFLFDPVKIQEDGTRVRQETADTQESPAVQEAIDQVEQKKRQEEVETGTETVDLVVDNQDDILKEVFDSNSDIKNIGTFEQYKNYINTIFTNSFVKNILFHGTIFNFSNFSKSKLGKNTNAPSASQGFFFTNNRLVSDSYITEDRIKLQKRIYERNQKLIEKYGLFDDVDNLNNKIKELENLLVSSKNNKLNIEPNKAYYYSGSQFVVYKDTDSSKYGSLKSSNSFIDEWNKLSGGKTYKYHLVNYEYKFEELSEKDIAIFSKSKITVDRKEKAKNNSKEISLELERLNFIKDLLNNGESIPNLQIKFYWDKNYNSESLYLNNYLLNKYAQISNFSLRKPEPTTKFVKLNIENPFIFNYKGKKNRSISYFENIKNAKKSNNDGAILENTYDSGFNKETEYEADVFIVFEPEQIHILGSEQDVRNFKTFVKDTSKEKTKDLKSLKPETSIEDWLEEGDDSFNGEEVEYSSDPSEDTIDAIVETELTVDEKLELDSFYEEKKKDGTIKEPTKKGFIQNQLALFNVNANLVFAEIRGIIGKLSRAMLSFAVGVSMFMGFSSMTTLDTTVKHSDYYSKKVNGDIIVPDTIPGKEYYSTFSDNAKKVFAYNEGRKLKEGYIIADKTNAVVHFIDKNNNLISTEAALFGRDFGDRLQVPNIGYDQLDEVDKAKFKNAYDYARKLGIEQTTASGAFEAYTRVDDSYGAERTIILDKTNRSGLIAAFHPSLQTPSRIAAENTADINDNKITFGCVSVNLEKWNNTFEKNYSDTDKLMFYILPEEFDYFDPTSGTIPTDIVNVTEQLNDLGIDTSKYDTNIFKYKLEDNKFNRKVWDRKTATEWFNKNLPNVPMHVLDDLYSIHKKDGVKAWGLFYNAAVYIAKNAPMGTAYHEAFHAVFNLFLTEQQQTQVLTEAFNKYGKELGISKEQFEEALFNKEANQMMFKVNETDTSVDYTLKVMDILNSDNAKSIFNKGQKNNWTIEKIMQELQIPKPQRAILKDIYDNMTIMDTNKKGKSVFIEPSLNDFITAVAANYSQPINIKIGRTRKLYPAGSPFDSNSGEFGYMGNIYELIDEDGGPWYLKNGDPITESEFRYAESKSGVLNQPSNTYKQLTVPGGSNYREVEISTPGIIPSIKGHADFSTNEGIGWFRTDTENDGLGETETRRILEVQSDLFQKGRDLKDVIEPEIDESSIMNLSTDELTFNINEIEYGADVREIPTGYDMFGSETYSPEPYFYKIENGKFLEIDSNEYNKARRLYSKPKNKNSKNLFLQTLNKDNNWVTFFVKSIVQDSIKKGFKTVLFPKGNTAMEIEGQTTLDEFINFKERRIESLLKTNKLLDKGDPETIQEIAFLEADIDTPPKSKINIEEEIEKNNNEIKRLEKEVKDVKEQGYSAFAPIYKFYEQTLTNVLNKNGFNPVEHKDRFGKSWNMVELTDEVKKANEKILLKSDNEEFYKSQGVLTQLEEKMANEFEEYKLQADKNKEKADKNILTKLGYEISNFFKKLYTTIKVAVTNKMDIDTLFFRINSGAFAGASLVRGRKRFTPKFSVAPSNFNPRELYYRVRNMMSILDKSIEQLKVTAKTDDTLKLYRIALDGDIEKNLVTSMKNPNSVIRQVRAAYQELPDNLKAERKADFIKFIKGIRDGDNFGELYKHLLMNLSSRGVTITFKQGLNPDEINDDVEIDENEDGREGWQIKHMEVSPFEKISQKLRRWLENQPVVNNVSVKDGQIKFDYKKDDLGFIVKHDGVDFYKDIQKVIGQSRNPSDILSKLEEYKEYSKILDELKSDSGLLTELWRHVGQKNKPVFLSVVHSHNNKTKETRLMTFETNRSSLKSTIANDINTNIHNRNYSKVLNPDYSFDKNKLADYLDKLEKHLSNLRKPSAIAKANFDKAGLLRVFRDLGVILPRSAEMNMKLSDYKNIADNVHKIFTKIHSDMDYTDNSYLSNIANVLKKYASNVTQDMHVNSEGGKVYEWINSNFIGRLINKLKQADSYADTRAFYSSDPFYKNNPFLLLINEPIVRQNLEFAILSDVKQQGENKGTPYTSMSDKQTYLSLIGLFNNNRSNRRNFYIPLPVLSDAPVMIAIKVPYVEKILSTDADSSISQLYNIAEAERLAILDFKANPDKYMGEATKNKVDKKTGLKNGEKMHLFPYLQKDVDKWNKKQVMAKIALHLEKKVLPKEINNLKKLGIIETDSKGELISKYIPTKNVKEFLREFVFNYTLMHAAIIPFASGNPAYYKSIADFYKRAKQVHSPGTVGNKENTWKGEKLRKALNAKILNDIEKDSDIANEIEIAAGKEIADKYRNGAVNVADGQAIIDPYTYRQRMISLEEWNDDKERVYLETIEGKYNNDVNVMFNVIKPFYFNHHKYNGIIYPTQIKNSEAIYTPAFVRDYGDAKLKTMFNDMGYTFNEDGTITFDKEGRDKGLYTDIVTFESAVKVGRFGASDDITKAFIHKISFDAWMLQQETPTHHIDDKGIFGTQIMKLIIGDLEPTKVFPNGMTGEEIIKEYNDLLIEDIKSSYEKISEEVKDFESLVKLLEIEVARRNLGEQYLEGLELTYNELLDKIDTKLPLWHPIHAYRVEAMVNSMFKKKVTNRKFSKAAALINVTPYGLKRKPKIKWVNDDPAQGIDYIEAYISPTSELLTDPKFLDSNGNIDVAKVEAEDPKLLEGIVYRIPTEDKYSMYKIKAIGFLPVTMGGIVILAEEAPVISGLDFDVDKVFGFFYATEVYNERQDRLDELRKEFKHFKTYLSSEEAEQWGALTDYVSNYVEEYNGRFDNRETFRRLIENSEFDNSEVITSKVLDVYDSLSIEDLHAINGMRFTKGDNNIKDNYPDNFLEVFAIKEIMRDYNKSIKDKYPHAKAAFDRLKKIKTAGKDFQKAIQEHSDLLEYNKVRVIDSGIENQMARDNRKLDLMRTILGDSDVVKSFLNPGGFEDITRITNYILESQSYDSELSLTTPDSFVKIVKRMLTGKQLIGIAANHNAVHALWQQAEKLILNGYFKFNNISYFDLNRKLEYGSDRLITRNISQNLAAFVDNGKDPKAEYYNMNIYTADTFFSMLHAGIDLETAMLFIAQPIVKEFVNRYFNNGGNYQAEQDAIDNYFKLLGLNIKNKYSFFNEDFRPANFDVEFLRENIGKEVDYKNVDHQNIFLSFLYYRETIAKSVGDLVSATKLGDTGVGPTIAKNSQRLLTRQRALNSEINGVHDLFQQLDFTNALYEYGVNKASKDVVNAIDAIPLEHFEQIFDTLISSKDSSSLTEQEIELVYRSMFDALTSKHPKFRINSYEQLKKIVEDLEKHQSNGESDYYPFINKLKIVTDGNYKFIETGVLDKFEINSFRNAWRDMLLSPIESEKQLANDLVKYAFSVSGFRLEPKSFSHLIPVNYLLDGDLNTFLYNEKINPSNFTGHKGNVYVEQFLRNNYRNFNLKTFSGEDLKISTPKDIFRNNLVSIEDAPPYIKVKLEDDIYLYKNNGGTYYRRLTDLSLYGNKPKIKRHMHYDLESSEPKSIFETPSNVKFKGKMSFDYNGNKRSEVSAESTIDAIILGERTATTRYQNQGNIDYWKKAKVGDLIEFSGKDKKVIVEVTKPLHKLKGSKKTANDWSKLEGWSVEYFNDKVKPKLDEAWQLEYKFVKEIGSSTRDLQNPQTIESPEITVEQGLTSFETFVNHSGGAAGADSMWDEIGKEFGMINNRHYHAMNEKTPKGNIPLSNTLLEAADEHVRKANETLQRKYPTSSKYVDNLLRRNWYQVSSSDAVFAIGELVNEKTPIVKGGTGWAVQMALDNNKSAYVFDQSLGKWFLLKKELSAQPIELEQPPILTEKFAGVGTRKINDAGKQAIRDVYEETKKSFTADPNWTEQANDSDNPLEKC